MNDVLTDPATSQTTPREPRRLPPRRTDGLLTSEMLWILLGVPAVTLVMWIAGGGLTLSFASISGLWTGIGQLAGLAAGLAGLAGLGLAARPAMIERRWGLDRMLGWHRWTGMVAVFALVVHIAAVVTAYSLRAGMSPWQELVLLFGEPWMPPAYVAAALMGAVALTSWRRIKNRMAYETWYYLHVLGYLAVVLALGHVLVMGSDSVDNWAARAWWLGLYIATAGLILWSRVRPLVLSLVRPLRVTSVERLPDGAMSIWVAGPRLRSMSANAGQFFSLRFAERGLWWQTHPYSMSAEPFVDGLRFTFRPGDDAAAFSRIHVGTRVWLEGPYGRFTPDRSADEPLVLIAGGSGIAPIRGILADVSPAQRPEVIVRVSRPESVWFLDELRTIITAKNGRLHLVHGPRISFRSDPLSAQSLAAAIPDIGSRAAYVCGPTGMTKAAVKGLSGAGVTHIHTERYAY